VGTNYTVTVTDLPRYAYRFVFGEDESMARKRPTIKNPAIMADIIMAV
jgi:hypothetical protein